MINHNERKLTLSEITIVKKLKRRKDEYYLTETALREMKRKQISKLAVMLALLIGVATYKNGAKFYTIGEKEVEKYSMVIDIEKFRNTVVICSCEREYEDTIITTYKTNNKKLSEIRKGIKRRRRNKRRKMV